MTKFQISDINHSSRPVLSVIIPVYNEEATIGEVIEAVKQLQVKIEIIVVNDGSTDGTADILAE
ncbi:MAG: glycosyltransferase family 2 protein, partial [Fidelibacterota bacterium]